MWEEKQAELRSFLSQHSLFHSSAAEKVQHLWLRQGDRKCPVESPWDQLTPEQFCPSAVPTLPDPSSLLAAQVLLLSFSQFGCWEASKAGTTALPPLGRVAQVSLRTVGKDITRHLAWP